MLLLPEDPDASCARLGAALARATGCHVGVIVNDSVGRAWRRGQIGTAIGCWGLAALAGPARPAGPVRPRAAGERGGACRPAGEPRIAPAGPGGRGPARRAGARRLRRSGGERHGGRSDPAARAGPFPMTEQPKVVALSGGVGGAKLVVGLAHEGRAGPAAGDRQWRRRFRASRAHDLPGCRHAALCRRRARQSRDGLGPARRELDLHARAGRSRRPLLVPARRRRPRAARAAQRAPAPGRAPERDHRRSAPAAWHPLPHPADERRAGPDLARHRCGPARLPGLVRRTTLRARGERARLRRGGDRQAGAGPGRGIGRQKSRGDRDLPLEPPDQRGADSGRRRAFAPRSSGRRRRLWRSRRWSAAARSRARPRK